MNRKVLLVFAVLFCLASLVNVLPSVAGGFLSQKTILGGSFKNVVQRVSGTDFGDNVESSFVNSTKKNPRIAIVIDDFGGYNRKGVKEMLALDCPLTCAVMPKLPYTHADAELAHKNGKEVILHMPMEAFSKLPESWYGTCYIKNNDDDETAKSLVKECLADVPYAVGMNIHIGSGVSRDKRLMSCIIKTAEENGKYFLDSWTTSKSVCDCVAEELGIKTLKRYEFLERLGERSYAYAVEMLKTAISHAKKYGDTIVIGHIGAEGGTQTYEAIKDMLPTFKAEGIKLVKLSELL